MMKYFSTKAALFVLAATVVVCPVAGLAQHASPDGTPGAVRDFLEAWLSGNDEIAMSYFSTSEQAINLAPESISTGQVASRGAIAVVDLRKAYLKLLDDSWMTHADLAASPAPVNAELIALMEQQFDVDVVSGVDDPFIAYVANNAMSIESFDAAGRGAAATLLATGRPTLGVLVELPAKRGHPHPGPLATFWQEEGGKWRIQMVGTILP